MTKRKPLRIKPSHDFQLELHDLLGGSSVMIFAEPPVCPCPMPLSRGLKMACGWACVCCRCRSKSPGFLSKTTVDFKKTLSISPCTLLSSLNGG